MIRDTGGKHGLPGPDGGRLPEGLFREALGSVTVCFAHAGCGPPCEIRPSGPREPGASLPSGPQVPHWGKPLMAPAHLWVPEE